MLQAFVTLVLFMIILFVATRAAGDPATIILPADATPEQIQMLRERIGTDRSYVEQFAIFMRDMATLNFGRSIVYREPVVDLIGPRITASLKLQFASLILILCTAFPLGVLRRDAPREIRRSCRARGWRRSARPRPASGSVWR